jgi:hypothetical protein
MGVIGTIVSVRRWGDSSVFFVTAAPSRLWGIRVTSFPHGGRTSIVTHRRGRRVIIKVPITTNSGIAGIIITVWWIVSRIRRWMVAVFFTVYVTALFTPPIVTVPSVIQKSSRNDEFTNPGITL